MDLAGDGYFFDPGRSEAEGSFFFCFAEDGSHVFFPTFRNFLAATIAGHESGVMRFASHGAETVDYVRAHKLWRGMARRFRAARRASHESPGQE